MFRRKPLIVERIVEQVVYRDRPLPCHCKLPVVLGNVRVLLDDSASLADKADAAGTLREILDAE